MSNIKPYECRSCGKINHINSDSINDIVSCEYCHIPLLDEEKLPNQVISSSETSYINPNTSPYSIARPFWYVSLMMMMTLGYYQFVWFYRTWKLLLIQYDLKGNAVINAIFSPLCLWSFFKYAFLFGKQGGYISSWNPLFAANLFFSFCIVERIIDTYSRYIKPFDAAVLNLITLILIALSLIPLKEGVNAMNAGIANVQPNSRIRMTLSPWSIVFVVLGSVAWLLIFFYFYIIFFNII